MPSAARSQAIAEVNMGVPGTAGPSYPPAAHKLLRRHSLIADRRSHSDARLIKDQVGQVDAYPVPAGLSSKNPRMYETRS